MSLSTSTNLVRRVQQQDGDAWRQLTDLYGPLVFDWCRRGGLRDEDAADVFQEVWTSVACSLDRFDPQRREGTFRGWLWTITRNKVRDHFRKQQRHFGAVGGSTAQLRLSELPDSFSDDFSDPPSDSGTSSLYKRALKMIEAEFEPRTWQAFMRAAIYQHSTDDIAEDLHISAASVRQAKSRVLRRLRQFLGDFDS